MLHVAASPLLPLAWPTMIMFNGGFTGASIEPAPF